MLLRLRAISPKIRGRFWGLQGPNLRAKRRKVIKSLLSIGPVTGISAKSALVEVTSRSQLPKAYPSPRPPAALLPHRSQSRSPAKHRRPPGRNPSVRPSARPSAATFRLLDFVELAYPECRCGVTWHSPVSAGREGDAADLRSIRQAGALKLL